LSSASERASLPRVGNSGQVRSRHEDEGPSGLFGGVPPKRTWYWAAPGPAQLPPYSPTEWWPVFILGCEQFNHKMPNHWALLLCAASPTAGQRLLGDVCGSEAGGDMRTRSRSVVSSARWRPCSIRGTSTSSADVKARSISRWHCGGMVPDASRMMSIVSETTVRHCRRSNSYGERDAVRARASICSSNSRRRSAIMREFSTDLRWAFELRVGSFCKHGQSRKTHAH